MAKLDTKKGATIAARFAAAVCEASCYVLAWGLTVGPAVLINIQNDQGASLGWVSASAASVLICPALFWNAAHGTGLIRKLIAGLLFVVFLAGNLWTANDNSSAYSEAQRSQKTSQIIASSQWSRTSQELENRRNAQAAIAGEEAPENIAADKDKTILKNAGLWRAANQCDLSKLGSKHATKAQRDFCGSIKELDRKHAAALKRDLVDAEIAAHKKTMPSGAKPESIDPGAENLSAFLGELGFPVPAKLVSQLRDRKKSAILELLSAFGPSMFGFLIGNIFGRKQKQPAPQRPVSLPGEKPKEPESEPKARSRQIFPAPGKSQPDDDPELTGFRQRCTEPGLHVYSGPLWDRWCEDCAERGVHPGTRQRFGRRLSKQVTRDPNNGRPRYLGIKLKEKPVPRLRLVSGSG
jgi:hypothetical protein